MDKKIQVIGNSISNIEKEILNHLKNKGLSYKYDSFRRILGVYSDEVISEDEHNVLIHVHSGSNEGYYICVGTVKGDKITNYFLFRFHSDLEAVIQVQNELLKILEI
ncbi:MAG: hypothetical protein N4A62_21125 [Marinisporobacter sp.]|jgi:predicted RNase H-like nuclease (RuvC/YqgF family)|nr:hypothetical protein [Marinisporobacter sp.]